MVVPPASLGDARVVEDLRAESGAEQLGRFLGRHRKLLGLFVIVVAAVFVYRRVGTPDRWSGWVYPAGVSSPPDTWRSNGPFESLEQCRTWARAELAGIFGARVPHDADYECGLNCKFSVGAGVSVCERTLD